MEKGSGVFLKGLPTPFPCLPIGAAEPAGDPVIVYNMCVAGAHTFFAGKDSWGWAVWVHNTLNGECFKWDPGVERWRDPRGRFSNWYLARYTQDLARIDRICAEMKRMGKSPSEIAEWSAGAHARADGRLWRAGKGESDTLPAYPAPPGISD
jgi:hypothetical protein